MDHKVGYVFQNKGTGTACWSYMDQMDYAGSFLLLDVYTFQGQPSLKAYA